MPGRPLSNTYQAVMDAGHRLQQTGRMITGTALRAELGSGRPDVLMRIWTETASAASALLSETLAELDALGADLRQSLIRLINQALRAHELSATARVRDLTDQLQETESVAAQMAQEYETRIEALEREIEKRNSELDVLRTVQGWIDAEMFAAQVVAHLQKPSGTPAQETPRPKRALPPRPIPQPEQYDAFAQLTAQPISPPSSPPVCDSTASVPNDEDGSADATRPS